MKQTSDNDLLIRIDERVNTILERLTSLEKRVENTVNINQFMTLAQTVDNQDIQIDKLNSWKTKVTGIVTGISFISGVLSTVMIQLSKEMIRLKQ